MPLFNIELMNNMAVMVDIGGGIQGDNGTSEQTDNVTRGPGIGGTQQNSRRRKC